MRDNMIVNLTGLVGHCMPIDLNIVHLFGYLKVSASCILDILYMLSYPLQFLFATKGLYSTWERVGSISAIVEYLQNIKKQVTSALGCSYKGTTHTNPDTSDCVWKVANKIEELGLDKFEADREGNATAKKTVNILSLGKKRLKSSILATFNNNVHRLHDGYLDEDTELDLDDMPPAAWSFEGDGQTDME
jgi:hypothetical protein